LTTLQKAKKLPKFDFREVLIVGFTKAKIRKANANRGGLGEWEHTLLFRIIFSCFSV
jgi:hypothetical protein